MLNQVVLIGRIVRDLELVKKDTSKYCRLLLAVPRSFKNAEGVYESDFIDCLLWNNMASNTCEYCKKGDLVGLRGRLQSSRYEKDGEMVYKTEIIGEKVTFLSKKEG